MITMTEKEMQEFTDAIRKRTEELIRTKDKKLAREMLYDAGIVTKTGKIKKGMEGVCILLSRDSS